MAVPSPPSPGSLWQDESPLNDMFANIKARRVGDIVTVRIVESSSASNKASTTAGRESSISGQIESFLGYENKFSQQPAIPSTPSVRSPPV